jgi:hypothetical protein
VANVLELFRNGDVGFIDLLDLSLNKLSDLVGHQLANLDRQSDPTPRELMQHSVRRERAIGNKDWSLVGRVDLFSAVDLHVREPSVGHPRKSALPRPFIIAKLETINRVVGSIPNDQVEEVIAKPPAVVIAADRVFGRFIEHREEGLTRPKISDRARERAWLQAESCSYIRVTHRSGARFAASFS